MRYVLFLLGALAAGLAVATMIPSDISDQARLGICSAAGLGAPALVVLWTRVQLKDRPRLRASAPWIAGFLLQGVAVAVPMLYGKQPEDAVAVAESLAAAHGLAEWPVENAEIPAERPSANAPASRLAPKAPTAKSGVTGAPVHWYPRWIATIGGPGREIVTNMFVDRPRNRVIVAGTTIDRSATNSIFVSARSIADGSEQWTHRFVVDESGTPYFAGVDESGAVDVIVSLRGVLTLPNGRELGARVRQVSTWSLRIIGNSVEPTRVHSVIVVPLASGDRVRNGDGTIERVAPNGTLRWSLPRKPVPYLLTVIRDRVHAIGTSAGDDRMVIDVDTGRILERGPWFTVKETPLQVAMTAAPSGDMFQRMHLPLDADADTLRPDGTKIVRTGDWEYLVERVDDRFAPKWTRVFSNRAYDRRMRGIEIPTAPFVLPSGAVLVVGAMATQLDLGDRPLEPVGGSDVFLTELDPDDGTTRATQRLGGAGFETLATADVDAGELFLTGAFSGSLDFEGTHRTPMSRNGDDSAEHEAYVALLAP